VAHMATLSSKGQLVIPAELRKKLRLKAGTRLAVEVRDGKITVTPNPLEAVLALRGKYAGLRLEEELAEARRLDEKKLEALSENLRTRR
jgi:AbrB family looped-hinge helix DNA binding protein